MEAFDSVHLGHHVVHQNAVIVVVLGQPQALRPARGGVNLNFCLGQQLGDHHQIHIIVVHHQDVSVGGLEALPIGSAIVDLGPGSQSEGPQLLFVHNVLLQSDDELGALGIDAVDADLAAHQIHQLLDDAQPQAGALNVAVFLLVHPAEGIEQIGDVLLLHALAGVLHRVPDHHPVEPLALTADGEGDRALAGVFHRVVQKVD